MAPDSMHKCFQLSLRVEKKAKRRHDPNKEEEEIYDSKLGVTLEEDESQVGQKKLNLQLIMEEVRIKAHFKGENMEEEDLLEVGFSHK